MNANDPYHALAAILEDAAALRDHHRRQALATGNPSAVPHSAAYVGEHMTAAEELVNDPPPTAAMERQEHYAEETDAASDGFDPDKWVTLAGERENNDHD